MKTPLLDDSTLQTLSSGAAQALLFLCSRTNSGSRPCCGLTVDLAGAVGCTRSTMRRRLLELERLRLIQYRSTARGLRVEVCIGRRYTRVPTEAGKVACSLPPSASKVLLAVCRCLGNATSSGRILISTIAARIGKSRRTVQLALTSLRRSGLLESLQTGRSCIYIAEVQRHDDDRPFDQFIARRARILLRLVGSIPSYLLPEVLTKTNHLAKSGNSAIRSIAVRVKDSRLMEKFLRSSGVSALLSRYIADRYHPHSIALAMERGGAGGILGRLSRMTSC